MLPIKPAEDPKDFLDPKMRIVNTHDDRHYGLKELLLKPELAGDTGEPFHFVLKQKDKYITELNWPKPEETGDKSKAMRFLLHSDAHGSYVIRPVSDDLEVQKKTLVHKYDIPMLNYYRHDGSGWMTVSSEIMDPSVFLRATSHDNEEHSEVLPFTPERYDKDSLFIVFKLAGEGYLTDLINSQPVYSPDKKYAKKFFLDKADKGQADKGYNIVAVPNPNMASTDKKVLTHKGGNLIMAAYGEFGSSWIPVYKDTFESEENKVFNIHSMKDVVSFHMEMGPSYTIAAWAKADSAEGGNIVSARNGSHAIFENKTGVHTGHNSHWSLNHLLDPTDWHHIAVTYDEPNRLMKLYVNGNFVNEEPNVDPFIPTNDKMIEIGCYSKKVFPYNGQIKAVMVLNTVKDQNYITAIHDATK